MLYLLVTVKLLNHFGIVCWKHETVAKKKLVCSAQLKVKKKQKKTAFIIYFQADHKRTVNRKKEGSYNETLIPVYSFVVSYNT